MNEMIITEMLTDDFKKASAMADEWYREKYGAEYDRFMPMNAPETLDEYFVVKDGDEIAGCGALRFITKKTAELKRVFVAEGFREQGIARSIVKACEDEAKRRGFTEIVLETDCGQRAARRLYDSLGYVRIPNFGEFENEDKSVCMKKTLVFPKAGKLSSLM